MREEEGDRQEETLQQRWKMPHARLAEEEGRRGGRGNEGMVGRGEERERLGRTPAG